MSRTAAAGAAARVACRRRRRLNAAKGRHDGPLGHGRRASLRRRAGARRRRRWPRGGLPLGRPRPWRRAAARRGALLHGDNLQVLRRGLHARPRHRLQLGGCAQQRRGGSARGGGARGRPARVGGAGRPEPWPRRLDGLRGEGVGGAARPLGIRPLPGPAEGAVDSQSDRGRLAWDSNRNRNRAASDRGLDAIGWDIRSGWIARESDRSWIEIGSKPDRNRAMDAPRPWRVQLCLMLRLQALQRRFGGLRSDFRPVAEDWPDDAAHSSGRVRGEALVADPGSGAGLLRL